MVVSLALAACGGTTETTVAQAGVYVATVRALVPSDAPDDAVDDAVFLGTEADDGLALALQAEILEALDDYEQIRFVDSRAEALEEREPLEPVRNEGVYLEFQSVEIRGDTADARVLRYEDATTQDRVELVLERAGTTWSVVEQAALE